MVLAITPRSEHPISRKMIDEEALKVLYRLHGHGFLAYLVGGSVRDLLLGKIPKDFDVATNAHPHEIRALFKNSRIIGRRFRLVQVYFKGGKIVQVATFRSRSEFEEGETEDREVHRTESFGTPEEDALRRDITINGLFYNIADFTILDYVGGMADLQKGLIRSIGDADEKFREDPVRMIRAIRHAARTGFSIENRTSEAILRHRDEIIKCSPSRLRDEFLRDLKEGAAERSFSLMLQTGLLFSLFPDLFRAFGDRNPGKVSNQQYFLSLFHLTDHLIELGRPVSDFVLLALFVAPLLRSITPEHHFLGEKEKHTYLLETIRWSVHQILTPLSFSKGTKEMVYQILASQPSLNKALQKGVLQKKLKTKKYFLESLLFWGVEAQAKGEKVPPLLARSVPPGFLPWWPKEIEKPLRPSRFFRRRRRPRWKKPHDKKFAVT